MKELQKILKDHPAKWMIWEDEPNPKAVEKLKALGISSVVFKPSGNKPEEGDFLTQMRKNIESIKPAFAP
jgi:zinc transport system substrate-binding protein